METSDPKNTASTTLEIESPAKSTSSADTVEYKDVPEMIYLNADPENGFLPQMVQVKEEPRDYPEYSDEITAEHTGAMEVEDPTQEDLLVDEDSPPANSLTDYCENSEDNHNEYDAISSIVIAHVETVAEEEIETTEPQLSDPDQLSDLPDKNLLNCDQNEFSTDSDFESTSTTNNDSTETSVDNRKVFKCQHCSYQSRMLQTLEKHSLIHTSPNISSELYCQHCRFVGGSRSSLTTHINKSHKEYTKQCEGCLKLVPFQLKKHHQSICVRKVKKEIKKEMDYVKPTLRSVFKCDTSLEDTKDKDDLSAEPEPEIPESKLKPLVSVKLENRLNCIYCSFKGKSDRSLMIHSVKTHPNVTQRCTKCINIVLNHLIEDHLNKCEGSTYRHKKINALLNVQPQKLQVRKPEIYKTLQPQKQPVVKLESGNDESMHKCPYCSFTSLHKKVVKKHLELHEIKKLPVVKCDQCDFKAPSVCLRHHRSIQHKHTNSSATRKEFLNCTNCNFRTVHQLKLKEHSLNCITSDGPMKCRHCPFKASNYRNLLYHSSSKHKSDLYKCKFCNLMIPTQLRVMHCNTRCYRNPNISFKCRFCSYVTNKKKHLDVHLRQHTVLQNPIVKCPQCDYKSTKQSVGKHRRTVHAPKTTSYKCGYCTFNTSEILELRKHVGTHNPLQLPDNHNCEYCSFKTRDFNQFQEHYMTSHQGSDCSLFDCPRCDFRSSIINMISHCVKRHQLEVTPDGLKQFNDTDTNSDSYQMFVKTELGGSQAYKCTICPETAKYQYQIKAHVLTHDVKKENPLNEQIEILHSVFGTTNDISTCNVMFICETCDYSTSSKEVLIQHKKTHNSPQTKCQKCRRSFGSTETLIAHKCSANTDQYTVKTDGKTAWYKCRSCQFKSCGKSRMLRHWSKRHQDNEEDSMFSCPFCPLRVDYKMELQKHILNCHGLGQGTDSSKKKCSYKCDACDFETSIKSKLHTHKVVHVNINEVRVYKTETYNVGMKGNKSTSLVFKKDKKDVSK